MQRDNAISHSIPNKYNPAARHNLNTCDGGHQSERGLTTQGISWRRRKRAPSRETSIGSRLNESNSASSFPMSEEYWSRRRQLAAYYGAYLRQRRLTMRSWVWMSGDINQMQHLTPATTHSKSTENRQAQAIATRHNTTSHRMPRRRSRSLPEFFTESNTSASNAFHASSSGHQSHTCR